MDIYIDFNKTSVYMVLKKSPRDLPVFPRGLISLIGIYFLQLLFNCHLVPLRLSFKNWKGKQFCLGLRIAPPAKAYNLVSCLSL